MPRYVWPCASSGQIHRSSRGEGNNEERFQACFKHLLQITCPGCFWLLYAQSFIGSAISNRLLPQSVHYPSQPHGFTQVSWPSRIFAEHYFCRRVVCHTSFSRLLSLPLVLCNLILFLLRHLEVCDYLPPSFALSLISVPFKAEVELRDALAFFYSSSRHSQRLRLHESQNITIHQI